MNRNSQNYHVKPVLDIPGIFSSSFGMLNDDEAYPHICRHNLPVLASKTWWMADCSVCLRRE